MRSTMSVRPSSVRLFALRAALVAGASAITLTGCQHGQFKLAEEPPAHREPSTTSIYGDWVLATPTDSTGFAGARTVEMNLDRSAFVLTATYPTGSPFVVRGTVTADEGLLTLTPTASTTGTVRPAALVLVAGQPVTVLASAAGNTMVFSTPAGVTPADPSSVWHRREAAKAAGTVPAKP